MMDSEELHEKLEKLANALASNSREMYNVAKEAVEGKMPDVGLWREMKPLLSKRGWIEAEYVSHRAQLEIAQEMHSSTEEMYEATTDDSGSVAVQVILLVIDIMGAFNSLTHLQKMLFLVERQGEVNLELLFYRDTYGPISLVLREILGILIKMKLVIKQNDLDFDEKSKVHSLNPEKRDLITRITSKLDENTRTKIISLVKKYRSWTPKELLDHIFSKHPSYFISRIEMPWGEITEWEEFSEWEL